MKMRLTIFVILGVTIASCNAGLSLDPTASATTAPIVLLPKWTPRAGLDRGDEYIPQRITKASPTVIRTATFVLPTSTATTALVTESTPTNTEAQPTATLPFTIGHIKLSGTIGDAGFTFAFATSVVGVTWIDSPSTCNQYDFVISDSSSDWTVIGTDLDPSDGISIEWLVPEHLSEASLMGEAFCEESSVIHSLELDYLFSGDAPPEGVCVLISGTMGDSYVYLEPSLSSKWIGFLPLSRYKQVFERTQNGWYRIDTSSVVFLEESQSKPEFGWISDIEGIRLFGPCDSVPIANGP